MTDEIRQENENLPPYYVYLLTDPDLDYPECIFYVGKGQGNRADQHEIAVDKIKAAEENRGEVEGQDIVIWKENEKETYANDKKIARIGEIKNKGKSPKIVVVGRYETEAEAYAVESTLIKWVYGFSNLTNAVHGHRHQSIRAKGDFNEISGIDIPRDIKGLYDGAYSQKQREAIVNNRVVEKLLWVKEELEKVGYKVSEPDTGKPQDPCVWVTGIHEEIRAQVKCQLGGDKIVINLRPVTKHQFTPEITALLEQSGFSVRNHGHYAPIADFVTTAGNFPGGVSIDRINTIIFLLDSATDKVKGLRVADKEAGEGSIARPKTNILAADNLTVC